jgi:hypothetical protein
MTTVYASHGRRYHRTTDCTAHQNGQWLHDHDDWVPGVPEPQPLRAVSETLAQAYGLTPCRSCLPVVTVWRSPSFGHEPYEYDGALICPRCWAGDDLRREFVYWPCTTARVLQLEVEPCPAE